MDKTTLVRSDFEAGRKIIHELEQRGIKIDIALWLQDDESGAWQLIISSPSVPRSGSRRIYEAIATILQSLDDPELGRDNISVASPNENLIKDLKRRVSTNDDLHDIRLDTLDLGGRRFRSARIYRVAGGKIEHSARVRVKENGRLGTVRGVVPTPSGPRYLVLHDVNQDDVQPLGAKPTPPVGADYAAQDLDFLYVVRTGGWPETYPDWLIEATNSSGLDLSVLEPGRRRRVKGSREPDQAGTRRGR